MIKNIICLLRVDTYGNNAPHINSDGTIIPAKTPHINIFDEQSGDHDAIPLPSSFKNADDIINAFKAYSTIPIPWSTRDSYISALSIAG